MDDFNELRDLIISKVEHILLMNPGAFTLVVDCEKCGHRTPHQIDTHQLKVVEEIADLVINQINSAQIILISHIYSAIMIEPQSRESLGILIDAWATFIKSLQKRGVKGLEGR